MFIPGPENVSLLTHADVVACASGDSGCAFTAGQTSRFCIVELFLKCGVSFATLAVGAAPDGRIFDYSGAQVAGAAAKHPRENEQYNPMPTHFEPLWVQLSLPQGR
jgi:hypothetical protein